MTIDPHWVFENHKEAAQLIESLQRERDALAAHVARWKEWLGRDPECDVGDWMDDGWAIAKESPTISLARLKARWQAEELERLYIETQTDPEWVNGILPRIRELRRQA